MPLETDTRVGFRDIYRAVTESEVRVTAAIERAVSPLNTSIADHEGRIRALEAGAAGAPAEAKQAIAALKHDVASLEQALSNAAAVSGRRASDFSIAQKVIVTAILVSNFILGIVVYFTTQ